MNELEMLLTLFAMPFPLLRLGISHPHVGMGTDFLPMCYLFKITNQNGWKLQQELWVIGMSEVLYEVEVYWGKIYT